MKEKSPNNPKNNKIESNFNESIEEISPIRKSEKSLKEDSPNPKDFNLRDKHVSNIKKLNDDKSKDKLYKHSSDAHLIVNQSNSKNNLSDLSKINRGKSRDRLMTKESDKSEDKM